MARKTKATEKVPTKGMGRPPFKPSIEQRHTVEEMKYCGEPESVIARALGIDDDTMRKYFAEELADGFAARRKEIVGLLFKAARAGNVTAIKRLEEIGRLADAPDDAVKPARALKLGKKEVAKQDAIDAGLNNEWGDDLSPPPDMLPN